MQLSAAIRKTKGSGIAMVDGRPVIDGIREKIKISIVDAHRIFIQKHERLRRAQPAGAEIRILEERFVRAVDLRVELIKTRIRSHIAVQGARAYMILPIRRLNVLIRRAPIGPSRFGVVSNRAQQRVSGDEIGISHNAEGINIRSADRVLHRPGHPIRFVRRLTDKAAAAHGFALISRDVILIVASVKHAAQSELFHVVNT